MNLQNQSKNILHSLEHSIFKEKSQTSALSYSPRCRSGSRECACSDLCKFLISTDPGKRRKSKPTNSIFTGSLNFGSSDFSEKWKSFFITTKVLSKKNPLKFISSRDTHLIPNELVNRENAFVLYRYPLAITYVCNIQLFPPYADGNTTSTSWFSHFKHTFNCYFLLPHLV